MFRVQPGLRSETISKHLTVIRKEINKATVEIQAADKVVGRVCSSYSHSAVVPSEASAQLPVSREPGPAREVAIGGGPAPGGNRGFALCP